MGNFHFEANEHEITFHVNFNKCGVVFVHCVMQSKIIIIFLM